MHSAADTVALGEKIGRSARPKMVIALYGGLAAGKTTLTKGIAKGLDVREDVTSPTYTLISEYTSGRTPLYHMDAYRLDGEDDFLELGAEEFFYGNGVCVVEWSERIAGILPPDAAKIVVQALPDGKRKITVADLLLEDALS